MASATGRVLKAQLRDLYDMRIGKAYIQGYGEYPSEYEPMFNIESTEREDERQSFISTLGLWVQKQAGSGDGLTFDSVYQGDDTTITPYTYALGVTIEQETWEDDPHGLVEKIGTSLGQTGRLTSEYLAASVFNDGFAATTAAPWMSGGDSQYLFDTDHPIQGGGTYANKPSTAIGLSLAALQAADLNFRKMVNARGLPWPMKPRELIIPPDLKFLAWELLHGENIPYTADNTGNALQGMYTVREWVFLNDSNNWFLSAGKSADRGIQTVALWRVKPEFDRDNQFETGDRRYKGRFRQGFGYWSWPGLYGSNPS